MLLTSTVCSWFILYHLSSGTCGVCPDNCNSVCSIATFRIFSTFPGLPSAHESISLKVKLETCWKSSQLTSLILQKVDNTGDTRLSFKNWTWYHCLSLFCDVITEYLRLSNLQRKGIYFSQFWTLRSPWTRSCCIWWGTSCYIIPWWKAEGQEKMHMRERKKVTLTLFTRNPLLQ